MSHFTLYIVDDEHAIRKGLTRELSRSYSVKAFENAMSAINAVRDETPDLLLLDIGLPDINGIEVLKDLKQLAPHLLVIMITAYEDIGTVISAMKLGAYDYVVKPLHMDSLENTIRNALETIRLRKELQELQEKFLQENVPCFIGESNAIQDVMEFITLVAKSPDTPILIQGETGTGKELIAGAVHYRSPQFNGPFITVNCAAIPQNLVESELFGYEKGAFSGAHTSGKKGLIDEAAGGTLFLDEIGDLHPEAQAKLLRFLEDGAFYRIGGTKKITVATRVVSASNKDLEQMVADNTFRKDLFYRLGVIKVQVPSLPERPDDIMPLANYFLAVFANKFSKNITGITPEASDALQRHSWEGNVRELKNIIERAALVCTSNKISLNNLALRPTEAKEEHSPEKPGTFASLPSDGIDLEAQHIEIDRHYIQEALDQCKGNESRAAKLLNLNRHTFRYKRKKCLKND
ncbi:MAG: sigma-54-dependent Fis family transcriptional regulator [Deltaproteobacteria bacterium]|nr:sigma-54-dependent Fis family transcriptional regulator [Deltaproteobacteria bacterium]